MPAAEETSGAVVVGGGLSGLLAAHVLARRFERVTVIERDALSAGAPEFRPGAPQSRHVHILWSRGVAALDDLLPGVVADPEAAGGALIDAPRGCACSPLPGGSAACRERTTCRSRASCWNPPSGAGSPAGRA
ncbi:FAD-dependent oxidoreductase [Streptomyces sp. NBC_01198]|uniref:FAD-dependent oxidoreductase n=1 Tax=Streptomyces sp. NBC_01198 TaxID=2903769 RepID=UPI002E0F36FA|nr:NAD(P)-binding protein [Streptomyces sp. NBC_01198]